MEARANPRLQAQQLELQSCRMHNRNLHLHKSYEIVLRMKQLQLELLVARWALANPLQSGLDIGGDRPQALHAMHPHEVQKHLHHWCGSDRDDTSVSVV
jgi:hypothetical protein